MPPSKKSPPYAALPVTLLDDEEYRVLLGLPGGTEAFGFYCAVLITGRERFQQGKANRILGTEALRFENRLQFLEDRAGVPPGQTARSLSVFETAAQQVGSEPWLHLDQAGRLIIRSFFQDQPATGGWGGSRSGAGRRPKSKEEEIKMIQVGNQVGNQDGIQDFSSSIQDESSFFKGNQEEIKSPKSQVVSPESVTTSESMDALDYGLKNLKTIKNSRDGAPITITNTITTASHAGVPACEAGSADCPSIAYGSHQECVELALDLFGNAGANLISHSLKELTLRLADENGTPRWDALAAALRLVDRIRRQPGATPVRSILASAYHWTDQWIVTGEIPPEPVEAPVIATPPRRRSTCDDTVLPPPFRPTEEQLARIGPPPGSRKPPEPTGPPRFKDMAEFAAEFAARKNLKLRPKDES